MEELINGKKWVSGLDELEVGKELFQMKSSNHLLGNVDALNKQLKDKGYLYIRQFHKEEEIKKAQKDLSVILNKKNMLDPNCKDYEFKIASDKKGGSLFSHEDVYKCPNYLNVVNSKNLMNFFSDLLDDEIFTFPYKWMRAVGEGDSTGIHYDVVYMGRGTRNLLSCWTALDDIPLCKGGLIMGEDQFRKGNLNKTYGEVDVDRDELDNGWFSKSPKEVTKKFGGHWVTSNFRMGDIVIFGMYQFHGSLVNTTRELRLSCDTRYQRQSEEKDDRFIGVYPKQHSSNHSVKMEDLKEAWAV
ncbi:MAG: phytanoyl-CoA dioxygenase [Planctomycetota bacterium]|nr:MAG: phytanoyl-CoA dioxygenase [Planctomycetota bacterium]